MVFFFGVMDVFINYFLVFFVEGSLFKDFVGMVKIIQNEFRFFVSCLSFFYICSLLKKGWVVSMMYLWVMFFLFVCDFIKL